MAGISNVFFRWILDYWKSPSKRLVLLLVKSSSTLGEISLLNHRCPSSSSFRWSGKFRPVWNSHPKRLVSSLMKSSSPTGEIVLLNHRCPSSSPFHWTALIHSQHSFGGSPIVQRRNWPAVEQYFSRISTRSLWRVFETYFSASFGPFQSPG